MKEITGRNYGYSWGVTKSGKVCRLFEGVRAKPKSHAGTILAGVYMPKTTKYGYDPEALRAIADEIERIGTDWREIYRTTPGE